MLVRELGMPRELSQIYADQAAAMRAAIERHFGGKVEGFDTYRYYDGNDVLRSWICIPLTAGIYDRRDGTVAALFSDRVWTDNGLLCASDDPKKTFWDRSTLYAFRGSFASGATEETLPKFLHYSRTRLLGEHVPYAVEAWPEGGQRHLSAESGLYCRVVTEGLFGIRPTGFNSFSMTPRLPKGWEGMSLKNIYAFGGIPFDIFVERKGGGIVTKIFRGGNLLKAFDCADGETLNFNFSR